MEVLDFIDSYDEEEWLSFTDDEREKLLTDKWMEIKQRNYDEWDKIRVLNIGEATILRALELHTGYNMYELKHLLVTFGDIGSVAEFVCEKSKQNRID